MAKKRSSFSEDDDYAEDGSEPTKPETKRPKTVLPKTPRDFDESVRSVEDLKDDFIAAIDAHVKGSTVFVVYDDEVHSCLPCLPLVHVSDIGVIPTPVTRRVFNDLLGSNVDDSSVANANENQNYIAIKSNCITFLNKRFTDDLTNLLTQDILLKLGLSSSMKVDAKFQRLFICGIGCKPCLFAETMPKDAFGVFIIILPSIYETSYSGSIKVTYRTNSNTFAMNKANVTSGCSYMALFSGCLLDFGEITDGYLTCLVYHLCQNEVGITPAPFDEPQSIRSISNLIENFMFSVDVPLLSWAFQGHKYYCDKSYDWSQGYYSKNQDFISNEDWLKDPDKRVLSLIRNVLAHDREIHGESRYYLYLAVAKLTVHGTTEYCECTDYDHRYEDECCHPPTVKEYSRSFKFEQLLPLEASTVNIKLSNFKLKCVEPVNQLINFSADEVDSSLWHTEKSMWSSGDIEHSRFALVMIRTDCAIETKFKSSPDEGLFHLKEIIKQGDSLEARKGFDIVLPLGKDIDKGFNNANDLIDIIQISGFLNEKLRFLEALSKLEKHSLNSNKCASILANAMMQLGNSDCVSNAFIKFIKSRKPSDYATIIHCCEVNCDILKPMQVTEILLNLLYSDIIEESKKKHDSCHLFVFSCMYVPDFITFMINAKTVTKKNMTLLSRFLTRHHPFNKLIKLAIDKNSSVVYEMLMTQIKSPVVMKEAVKKENFREIVSIIQLLQSNQKLSDCLGYLDALLSFMVRATDLFDFWKSYLKICDTPEKCVLEKLGKRMSELMIECSDSSE